MRSFRLIFLFAILIMAKSEFLCGQPQTFEKVIYDLHSTGGVQAYSLIPADSGFLLSGYRNGEPAAIRLNSYGNVLWCKTYDTPHKQFVCAVKTSDSGFLLAGSRIPGSSAGPGNIILVRITSAGDTVWSKELDMGCDELPFDLKSLADGSFILTGKTVCNDTSKIFIARLDANGDLIWGKIIQSALKNDRAYSIIQTTDQGFILAGSVGAIPYPTLIKLTSSGSLSWSKTFWESGRPFDLLCSGNDIYCFGECVLGIYLMKVDVTGFPQWGMSYSGMWDIYENKPGPRLQRCYDGGFAFIMGTEFINFFHGRLFRTDSTGLIVFSKSLKFNVTGIIQASDSGLVTCGNGPLGGVLDQVYTPQAGLIKLDANGNPGFSYGCSSPEQVSCSGFTPSLPDNPLTTEPAGTIVAHQCTVTSVDLNTGNGCVAIFPGTAENNNEKDISVFPNPTSGEITITSGNSLQKETFFIEIFDLYGKPLCCTDAQLNERINLGFLPDGMYLLTANFGNQKSLHKLIISHDQ